jgi:hypothetical protein
MINSFKAFKEACYKTELINTFTGQSMKVIRLWYTNEYVTRYFYTNNMREAYDMFKSNKLQR